MRVSKDVQDRYAINFLLVFVAMLLGLVALEMGICAILAVLGVK